MSRRLLVLALLAAGAAGCAGTPAARGPAGTLPELRAAGGALDARVFAAEAAFLFPEESRALTRSLLRTEFARREAQRLGLAVPAAEIEEALGLAVAGIEGGLPAGQDFEAWARERYGQSGATVRGVIRRHLEENLLYQLVLRAEARRAGGHRIHLLVAPDEARAAAWAAKLRQGADPRALAGESLDRGSDGRGERLLPAFTPAPLGPALASAGSGGVVGPLQLPGDRAWLVGRVAEVLPPAGTPPVQVLLDELATRPVDPLEARAWYEEMLRRYTAREALPAIQAPSPAFVPFERP